jgi:hypothetical protein
MAHSAHFCIMSDSESEMLAEYAARRGETLGVIRGVGGGGGVGQSGLGSTTINRFTGTHTPSRYFIGNSSTSTNTVSQPFVCCVCGRKGHDMDQCPLSDSSEGIDCFWCGAGDHHFTQCPRFKPTTALAACMICGNQGHLSCKPYKEYLLADRQTCANCGRKDHVAKRCPDPNMQELIDPKIYKGATISNRHEDRCFKCRQAGHSRSVCDKFRQYVSETGVRDLAHRAKYHKDKYH